MALHDLPGNPLKTVALRLTSWPGWLGAAARRRERHRYLNAEGRIEFSRMLADVRLSVYGLGRRQFGLRLRSFGWEERGRKGTIDRVLLRYIAGNLRRPERVLSLQQGPGGDDDGAPYRELSAVKGLVLGYGPKYLKDEYFRCGNIHRDWNLERLSQKPRRNVTVHVDGAPVDVELRSWEEPLQVVLARFTVGDHPALAVSLNLSRIEVLVALKTLVPFEQDSGALADHRHAYEEAGRELLRGSHPLE